MENRVDIPAWISVLLAGSFAGSVCYDYGFLSSLNLSFSDVPSTLSDHTRSALQWMPSVILGLFLAFAFELLPKSEKTASPNHGKTAFLAVARQVIFSGTGILFCISLLGFLLNGERVPLAAVTMAFYGWFFIAELMLSSKQGQKLTIAPLRVAFIVLPGVSIFLFGMGWSEAANRSRLDPFYATTPSAILRSNDGESSIVHVLRYYERGLLYREGKMAIFRQWDSIQSVSAPTRTTIRVGILCGWTPIGCRPPSIHKDDVKRD